MKAIISISQDDEKYVEYSYQINSGLYTQKDEVLKFPGFEQEVSEVIRDVLTGQIVEIRLNDLHCESEVHYLAEIVNLEEHGWKKV